MTRRRTEAGAALLLTLVALAVLGVLVVGGSMMATSLLRGTQQRGQAARASHVTEAGIAHAIGLMRGPLVNRSNTRLLRGNDDIAGTADDGYLTGYGLTGGQSIPIAGVSAYGGTYSVRILDDPADPDAVATTDLNSRIMIRCTGTLPDGSTASRDVVVAVANFPAIVVDGPLTISGNPTISGACGGVHANGMLNNSGATIVANSVSSASTIFNSGTIVAPGGIRSNDPPIPVPTEDWNTYCPAGADWELREVGGVPRAIETATGISHTAASKGWSHSSGLWDLTSNNIVTEGKVCVTGNIKIGSNPGTAAAPELVSFFATGSIEVSGNPYLMAKPGETFVMMAARGDLKLNGNPVSGGTTYGGALYAGAQCMLSGNPMLGSQIICKNGGHPAGSLDLISENLVNGNPQIMYDCNGYGAGPRRPVAWIPRFGA